MHTRWTTRAGLRAAGPGSYDGGMPCLSEDLLRTLPKVSLHDHLDGGLRPQTIIDLTEDAAQLPAATADELAAW